MCTIRIVWSTISGFELLESHSGNHNERLIMINDICLHGRLAGVKNMNFFQRIAKSKKKRIQVENEWRSSRAIVGFRCFACLQNEKPKTRWASEIPPGLCCENCIHYKESRDGTENGPDRICACLLYVTQEIGRTCASMCACVCACRLSPSTWNRHLI